MGCLQPDVRTLSNFDRRKRNGLLPLVVYNYEHVNLLQVITGFVFNLISRLEIVLTVGLNAKMLYVILAPGT
ncbi:hypothetical protein DNTS_030886 [Danionella cerebrum]|uniref:Uncharacterized protein n=1 Tax=Danionella cerebrum TaxID=2873325 RepID=A0A553N0N4_9TELE|nr:hypothetical protein DNTS_030886 [Danionella translucida]